MDPLKSWNNAIDYDSSYDAPSTTSPHYDSRPSGQKKKAQKQKTSWKPPLPVAETQSIPSTTSTVEDTPVFEQDPYQHIDHLGSGAYGYVDTVRKIGYPTPVYARKTIRITSGRDRELQLRNVEQEFKILRKLRHRHVMSVLELYQHRNKLSIIMLEVAEMDLKEYLEILDPMAECAERSKIASLLSGWQVCLIQAIDYLHEMRIKHKDLKPANILVCREQVKITDFGIAKDLIDEETTASLRSGGPQGSPMYMAPEIALGSKRGRAVDIFALGCVFLEMETCAHGGRNSRANFAKFRDNNGIRTFSSCPAKILLWLAYLWGRQFRLFPAMQQDLYIVPTVCGQLAFLMLDPNPRTRITSRQLSQIILTPYHVLKTACEGCISHPSTANTNLPLHSTYKPNQALQAYQSALPGDQPSYIFASGMTGLLGKDLDWEGAKRLWLATHMWW